MRDDEGNEADREVTERRRLGNGVEDADGIEIEAAGGKGSGKGIVDELIRRPVGTIENRVVLIVEGAVGGTDAADDVRHANIGDGVEIECAEARQGGKVGVIGEVVEIEGSAVAGKSRSRQIVEIGGIEGTRGPDLGTGGSEGDGGEGEKVDAIRADGDGGEFEEVGGAGATGGESIFEDGKIGIRTVGDGLAKGERDRASVTQADDVAAGTIIVVDGIRGSKRIGGRAKAGRTERCIGNIDRARIKTGDARGPFLDRSAGPGNTGDLLSRGECVGLCLRGIYRKKNGDRARAAAGTSRLPLRLRK